MSPPGSTGRITDRWTEPTLIGVKPVSSSSATNRGGAAAKPAGTAGMVGRRALPGLANPAATTAGGDKDAKPVSKDRERRAVSPSPTRHTRIPSTGNRALVMDVAQALNEAAQQQDKDKGEKEKEVATVSGVAPALTSVRQVPSTDATGETRKPSYERYSTIAMPPLTEERTPAASPVNTMARSVGQNVVLGGKVVGESPWSSLRVDSVGVAERPPSARTPSPSTKVHIGKDQVLMDSVLMWSALTWT